MSASMYNSPYTYKEPLPKIRYPPVFESVRKISFKHLLDSKFLALATLLFIIAIVISLICIISPFWFKLVFSSTEGTFGTEVVKRELSINTGIFFINENEFDNLATLNKNNNQDVVPNLLVYAQILEVMGSCGLLACMCASVILAFRRFASVTANFFVAFFATLSGVLLLLVFLFVMIMALSSSCDPYDTGSDCKYEDNLKWRVLPIYTQHFRIKPVVTPLIKLNWTFYISIIGAILVLAGACLLWIEAFMVYSKLRKIRYTQLRTARDPHEGDRDPMDHQKYVYQPPVKSGPMEYAMQPVMFQGGPYGAPPQQQPPPQSFGVGFAEESRPYSSSSSPPARRRSPPPMRRRSPSPPTSEDSAPPRRRGSPPPRRRSPSPPSRRRSPPPYSQRRRSPSPPRRGGPPSMNSSMSEGPYISREIDL